MNVGPVLHTIRIDGQLDAIDLSTLPALVVEQQVATLLTGFLDRSALFGVLAQLALLRRDLVEVRQVRTAGRPSDPYEKSPREGHGDRHADPAPP